MNQKQALAIIAQLGGNGFKVMTGAKNFTFGPSGLTFKIGQNSRRINGVRIQLEPTDVYTVEFLRINRNCVSVVSKHEDVYCHDLQELFEKNTGMYTTLY